MFPATFVATFLMTFQFMVDITLAGVFFTPVHIAAIGTAMPIILFVLAVMNAVSGGANGIIFLRVIAMTYIGLLINVRLRLPMCSFLLFAELMTLFIWLFATGFYHNRHPEDTRYLLMDMSLEKSGNVLNFSVSSVAEEICSASERITDFCAVNGMNRKKTMRVQLALEEIMTLITQINEGLEEGSLKFDLRAYSLRGEDGIRIRYAGLAFNPFQSMKEDDDFYMGISMIRKMVDEIHYQRTFGVNTLQVIMRERQDDGGN